MTLNKYQKLTQRYATRRGGRWSRIENLAHGLMSEVSEAVDLIRERRAYGIGQREALLKECGDVLWFIAWMLTRLGVKMDDAYARFGYQWSDEADWGLHLVSMSGKIHHHLYKAVRDDKGVVTAARKEVMMQALGQMLLDIARLVRYLGEDLESVMVQNIDKLASRHKRKKLHGSGDDR